MIDLLQEIHQRFEVGVLLREVPELGGLLVTSLSLCLPILRCLVHGIEILLA